MSAITPVTSMPADSASPSGMLTSALPQIRVQAKTVTGGAKLTVIQKNEGGVWFKVPQERVLAGKSLDQSYAALSLDVNEVGEITISNPFGSTAYHVLQENGGYAGNESGTVTAYIAGASAAVSAGDLSSANMAASGTLTVGGASTLTGAVSAGATLAVTGASTLTGQLNVNGGAKLAGSAPAAAADAVGLGVADINGAATAAIKEVFEGGGTLTRRVYSATGAVKQMFIDEAVADDATISLPVPSSGCVGMLDIATLIEGGKVAIQNDGTCTVLSGSANLVATDTDAKLAVFNDSATPKIKNRLGGSRRVLATYSWS
ncbi:MAG: hypothetical protein E6Q97_38090 [Desulfurellales bacterium]|nr:MAG: hypothetical protein E6Q97_38090 [Desulfurellales bacterium]